MEQPAYSIRKAHPGFFIFYLPEEETQGVSIEVSVDFGQDPADKKYTLANAWIRIEDTPIKAFITTVRVKTNDKSAEDLGWDIIRALNMDENFMDQVHRYIHMALHEHGDDGNGITQ